MVSSRRARADLQRGRPADRRADRLDRRADRQRPAAARVRRAHPHPERIAAQVALGYFLPHPATPTSTSTPPSCCPATASAGSLPAHAPTAPAPPRPRAGPAQDPDYRFAVVQSELYRRHLRLAVERLDVKPLAALPQAPDPLVPGSGPPSERLERVDAHAAGPQRARSRPGDLPMSTLLIDNYDSYTYNVFHLLAAVSGEEPIVVRNDMVSWRALSRWDFDAIVISPGPGPPRALARLRRVRGHPAQQQDPRARGVPRPPGPRAPARRDRRWRT